MALAPQSLLGVLSSFLGILQRLVLAIIPHLGKPFLAFLAVSWASCSVLSWQLSLTLASPSSANFKATLTAVSGSSPSNSTPYSLLAVWTTFPSTALPTTILRRNSRASQAKGSSSVAGLLGVGRLASLGASMLVKAKILSAGGPFLGGPRMTTAPPSITCFTTPLKYCLGAAGAAAAGALSVCSGCADILKIKFPYRYQGSKLKVSCRSESSN